MTDAADHSLPRGGITPLSAGMLAFAALGGVYFAVLTLVSGWDFTLSEFSRYWYYLVPLAAGFGVQVGLYTFIRQRLAQHCTKTVVASGTTSGVAMMSCCAHYLVNLVPVLGVTGLVTLVTEYQVQLFWLGLAANLAGIAYMLRRADCVSNL